MAVRPPIRLNHAELDALKGLPLAARVVYVEGIRPFMDFTSGVVGASSSPSKSISLQSLAEVLYVEPKPGRTGAGSRSRKQARVCIDVLVEAGLLSSMSVASKQDKRLILRCVLASTDESASKKQGTIRAQEQGTNGAQSKPSIDASLGESEPPQQGTPETPQQGTPPETDHKDTHKPRARAMETVPPDFSITDSVQARLLRAMVPLPFAEQLLLEFVNKNESKGFTSANWEAEFVGYCIQQKRFQESWRERNPKKNGLRLVASKSGEPSGGHGFNTED